MSDKTKISYPGGTPAGNEPLKPEDEGFFSKYIGGPYGDTVGSIGGLRLLAHMAFLGALGAGAGRVGSSIITPGLRNKYPVDKETTENVLTTAGGLIGAGIGGYTGSRGLDFNSASDLLKSLFERDYWRNNPDKLKERMSRNEKRLNEYGYNVKYNPFRDLKRYMGKQSSESGMTLSGFVPDIDVYDSEKTINEDPYMDPYGKQKISTLLDTSDEDEDGWASQFDIGRAALKLGAGFVPAYAAGRVAGALLRLPSSTKKRLSLAGGLAGAISNTGILKEI